MFFNNAFWKNEYLFAVLSRISIFLLGIVHASLLARYLGSALKGQFSFYLSIISTLSIVLSLGIHHAYPYFRKKTIHKRRFLYHFVTTSHFLFILFFLLSVVLVCLIHNEYSFIFMFSVLWAYNRVEGYILLVEKPNKRNLMYLACSFFDLAFIFILFESSTANSFFGYLAISFVEIVKFSFIIFFLFKYIRYRFISMELLKEIIIFGFFPMLAILMTTLNFRIDVMMLKTFSTITLSAIGVYSIGINLSEKILLIPDALQEVLLSKLAKSKGPAEVAFLSRMTFPLCLCFLVFILLFGRYIILFLFGPEYKDAYMVSNICVSGTCMIIFFKYISQYNIIMKKQVHNVAILSISIISNIILNSLFVPVWGINGAALSTALCSFICATIFILDFHFMTKIPVRDFLLIKKSDILLLTSLHSSHK